MGALDTGGKPQTERAKSSSKRDYPVREYIGAMAQELALMARWDGDEELCEMLIAAAARAEADRS